VLAHPPSHAVELLREGGSEGTATLLTEGLAEDIADAAQGRGGAGDLELRHHLVGVVAGREGAGHRREGAGDAGREQEVVELALAAEQGEEAFGVEGGRAPLGGPFEELSEGVELAIGEAASAQTAPQVTGVGGAQGEEAVEVLPVAVEVGAALDDHRSNGVAEGRAIRKADEGDDVGDVDRLRRGDGETIAAEHPEELIEDPEHPALSGRGQRLGEERLDQLLDVFVAGGVIADHDLADHAFFVDDKHRGKGRDAIGVGCGRVGIRSDGVAHVHRLSPLRGAHDRVAGKAEDGKALGSVGGLPQRELRRDHPARAAP
jgi:hypothetical protein